MAKKTGTSKAAGGAPAPKKASANTKTPLQKAVAATLASGKAVDRAKAKHATNVAALKKLEGG